VGGFAIRVAAVATALVAAYLALTFAQVWQASLGDDASPADAIVVLGAAQYDGRPSPVLEARLDHAAALFGQGLAPVVWVTGGRRPGDRFTEATAGALYLHARGVPDAAIRREVSGRNTWESLAAAARYLRAEGTTRVLLVSDPYHSYRLAAIAGELGLDARVAPTPAIRLSGANRWKALLRETVAVAGGRLVGYRRLSGVLFPPPDIER
jgi:uncharacterized SAM-binding protein YcdF (DUF218 family)